MAMNGDIKGARIPYSRQKLRTMGRPRTFSGRNLSQIAFPIGGIGAGSISLGGYGQLQDWEIFNRPGKGNRPAYTFFAIWAKAEGESVVTKVVESRIHPSYAAGHGLPREHGEGLPHLASGTFTGSYPFAQIAFDDPGLPVAVSLEVFNPFIPLNAEDSALPVVILKYCIENLTERPVDVTLAGSVLNVVGYNNEGPIGVSAPCFGSNVNEVVREEGFGGLRMTSRKYEPGHPQYGSVAFVTTERELTYQTKWSREGWFDELQRFWDGFSGMGALTDDDTVDPSPEGRTDVGSLGVKVHLEPEEATTIPFLIAWYFPKFGHYWGGGASKDVLLSPRYAARFADAWAVARYAVEHMGRLEEETRRFHDTLFASTLPDYVLDAVSSQMSIIKTNTCQWYEDGTFHAFEGCSDRAGCCMGSCTHVWNYEQTLAFLFPALERDMRVTDFKYNMAEDGYMAFRHPMPRGTAFGRGRPAADGQMGCIMKLYREWRLSGDQAFLEELWPYAKRALEFAWKEWDQDRDGVMEGVQHNTYDIEFYGPNTMMGTFYLGALRAAEEMARALRDTEAEQTYRALYEKGRKKSDDLLWDGEFYIQKYDETQALKYQYGRGCLSDQLLGQWFAMVVDLGHLLPEEHVQIALQSIFRYNWRTDFFDHPNCQRIYALNDEKGLLLCSWPKGGRPALPFVYSDEVWTGIEYQVAAHLIYEGFVDEGLCMVKGLRERYNGERRNPWDEFECGHHYARAMASWSVLLALSGFRYSAPEKAMGFAPRIRSRAFACFWSTGTGWGLFRQTIDGASHTAEVAVRFGTLELSSLTLQTPASEGSQVQVSCGGTSVPETVEIEDGEARVRCASPVRMATGASLWVVLSW